MSHSLSGVGLTAPTIAGRRRHHRMTTIRRSDSMIAVPPPPEPSPGKGSAPLPGVMVGRGWLPESSCRRVARLGAVLLGVTTIVVKIEEGEDPVVLGTANGESAEPGVAATDAVLALAVRASRAAEPVTGDAADAAALALPILGDVAGARSSGAIVLLDAREHAWTERERVVAAELAASAATELALRRALAVREAAEEHLRHGSLHDTLTGLANRALFMDRLGQAMRRARRHEQARFCVLFLDLDRFKVVNDSLGHEAGDRLLVAVSRRLQACVRSEDTVARLGGDEFAVLVEHVEDEHGAVRVAERIHLSLAAPINLGGYDVFTSASIGIVPSAVELEEAEYVLRGADMAMYRAKSAGRSRYELFDREMHALALTRLQTETDLRHAIERDEFVLHYQPIVSLATGQLSGFEALVRWRHPERGLVPPMEFIPVAEEMGLIVPIGQGVLHEACRQLREWQRRFPRTEPLAMAVNLSPKQFTQPNLVTHVADALSQHGLPPRCLRLEITESMIVENAVYTAGMLGQLQGLGVQVYLDDFGTGYSSLSYLHRLPFDAIKIDREFVEEMTRSAKAFQLVDVVRTLAQNIGGTVIAEGVETTEQLIALRDLGCEHAQGYYFSKPLDAAGVEALLGEDPRW